MIKNGVTIGIPVYNEESRVAQAIESAAPQCEHLIVADNASTDATEAVCRRLLAKFPHMEYVRHAENMGSMKNWFYLFQQAHTPYVLAVGSHDWIASDYVEKTKRLLDNDAEAVIAVGEACVDEEGRISPIPGYPQWNGIQGKTARERVKEFVFTRAPKTWSSYGLFRTQAWRDAYAQGALPAYGFDVVLLARMAQRGKILVDHGTRYCAWMRKEDSRQDYYRRVLAKEIDKRSQRARRAEIRLALYAVIVQQYRGASLAQRAMLRFSVMNRLGPFKTCERDLFYVLAYVPVKVCRVFQRAFRKSVCAS